MNLLSTRVICGSAVALAAALAAGGAQADTFVQTYENPGVQNSTATFTGGVSVETFDTRTSGTGVSFTTSFGAGLTELTYTGVQINAADQYGGAGGTGKYAVTFLSTGYSVTLSKSATYFGYWLSALDSGNEVDFYSGSTQVGTLSAAAVLAAIGSNSAYFGNPTSNFRGRDSSQPYAFVNFFDTDGSFDKVVFRESPAAGGYESDNHTIGTFSSISGNPVAAVPEPSTYALMLVGLVGAGVVSRRQRR